ncbi:MAG: YkgJ family cysteine cluster protein [Candidatus Woesearchaeota archaeon]
MDCRLSEYCINTCKAKCCKRGKLPLTSEEAKMFDKNRIDKNNHYDLTDGCEYLDKNLKCKIYDKRPKICKDYPFHEMGPVKFAITHCDAVQNGVLDEEIIKRKIRKF